MILKPVHKFQKVRFGSVDILLLLLLLLTVEMDIDRDRRKSKTGTLRPNEFCFHSVFIEGLE